MTEKEIEFPRIAVPSVRAQQLRTTFSNDTTLIPELISTLLSYLSTSFIAITHVNKLHLLPMHDSKSKLKLIPKPIQSTSVITPRVSSDKYDNVTYTFASSICFFQPLTSFYAILQLHHDRTAKLITTTPKYTSYTLTFPSRSSTSVSASLKCVHDRNAFIIATGESLHRFSLQSHSRMFSRKVLVDSTFTELQPLTTPTHFLAFSEDKIFRILNVNAFECVRYLGMIPYISRISPSVFQSNKVWMYGGRHACLWRVDGWSCELSLHAEDEVRVELNQQKSKENDPNDNSFWENNTIERAYTSVVSLSTNLCLTGINNGYCHLWQKEENAILMNLKLSWHAHIDPLEKLISIGNIEYDENDKELSILFMSGSTSGEIKIWKLLRDTNTNDPTNLELEWSYSLLYQIYLPPPPPRFHDDASRSLSYFAPD